VAAKLLPKAPDMQCCYSYATAFAKWYEKRGLVLHTALELSPLVDLTAIPAVLTASSRTGHLGGGAFPLLFTAYAFIRAWASSWEAAALDSLYMSIMCMKISASSSCVASVDGHCTCKPEGAEPALICRSGVVSRQQNLVHKTRSNAPSSSV
jgi:hypothetical protein